MRKPYRPGHLAYGGFDTTIVERPPCIMCGQPFTGVRTQKTCDPCRATPEFHERKIAAVRRWHRRQKVSIGVK